MTLIISDPTIFLELERMNILPRLFALGHELHVPDFILVDIKKTLKNKLDVWITSKDLMVDKFTCDQLQKILNNRTKSHIKDITSLCALWLASKSDAILITNDKCMQKEAKNRDIEVQDYEWILSHMKEAC